MAINLEAGLHYGWRHDADQIWIYRPELSVKAMTQFPAIASNSQKSFRNSSTVKPASRMMPPIV